MLGIILVILYTFLLAYLVSKSSFFIQSGLSKPLLLLGYLAKVSMAILYGIVSIYFIDGADTINFVNQPRLIYNTLYVNPLYYLELVFGPNAYKPPSYLYEYVLPLDAWSDVRTYTIYRISALIHLISDGNYYIHAVIWGFLSFTGAIGLYRTFIHYFPQYTIRILVVLFGLPSVMFWTSGVHKEGITLFCTGLICYHFCQILQKQQLKKRLFYLLLLVLLLGLLRPHYCLLLLVMLLCWGITSYWSKYALAKIVGIYVLGIALVTIVGQIFPQYSIFDRINYLYWYYVTYHANPDDIPLGKVAPTLVSTLQHSPNALFNMLFQPTVFRANSALQWFSCLEMLFYGVLMLVSVVFNQYKKLPHKHFLWACLFFAASYLTFMGLFTDTIGTLVRYRANVLLFWVFFFVMLGDWGRVQNSIFKQKAPNPKIEGF